MARGVLVGRDAAVDTILSELDLGRVPIVRGPGGIGKTAVLHHVVDRFSGPALTARGIDFLNHQRLLPFERAVGHPLVGDLEAIASDVRSVVGDGGLVILDNLQWADRDSIALLPALAARGPLALAVRTDAPGQPLSGAIVGAGELDLVTVDLGPLGAHDAALLVAQLGPGLPARAESRVLRQAGGNPLLLELLVRTDGVIDDEGEDAVGALLHALEPTTAHRLARLAVGLPVSTGEPGVDALVAAGMVSRSPDGWCVLESELLASAALGRLDERERQALHLEAAEHAGGAEAPAIAAEHLMLAGETRAAYSLATSAIEEAEPEPTSALLTLALSVAPDEGRWPLVERAVLLLLAEGDLEQAADLAAIERASGRDDPRYDVLDAYVLLQQSDSARAIELLDRALDEDLPELRAGVLAMRSGARASLFDVAGARADAELALELEARNPGRGSSAAAARFVLASTALLAGDESWPVDLRRALVEARRGRSVPLEVRVGTTLVHGLFLYGHIEEAIATGTELIDAAAARHDELNEFAVAKLLAAHRVICELAPREQLVRLDGLLRHPATRDDLSGSWSLAAIGWADRGELDRAEDALAHARLVAARSGADGEAAVAWAEAELAWISGSTAWAEEHARAGLARSMILNPATANCATLMAWSQFELGRPIAAPIPYVPYPVCIGLITEISAIEALAAGEFERAADLFADAQRIHERYFRRSALRCAWGIAESQRRAGDLEGALVTLKELEETGARSGITSLSTRVAASIDQCDPTGSRGRVRQLGQVTARQREVLSLVHGGMRTPEIAQRLGLSPSTVDTHIRGAMERLDVSSRAEAARRVVACSEAGRVGP